MHTFDGVVALGSHDGVRQDNGPEPGTPVRLRVVNTDSTPHRLTLAGTAFRVAAADGNDLHEPGEVSRVALRLAAGGRYDLTFPMPPGAVHRREPGAGDPPVAPARAPVLVLSKDGRPVTGSPLWLDTFDVRPGEVWRVALRADNPGMWMNHCHNLDHADQGMALHLAYVG
ncbi:MAG TPA: multicopper oxidase domain-containing protein [Candidatus Limnocylindrales bacterium]|nr:multicopper oxidase domain-containing protein [Candidatus Limnocylindrales bacterium]